MKMLKTYFYPQDGKEYVNSGHVVVDINFGALIFIGGLFHKGDMNYNNIISTMYFVLRRPDGVCSWVVDVSAPVARASCTITGPGPLPEPADSDEREERDQI